MSRSGYREFDGDEDVLAMGRWRAMLKSAFAGKRGRKFLTDLRDALDVMPVKRLITRELKDADGEVCAIGSVGVRRGVDMSSMLKPADCDQDDWDSDWESEAEWNAEKLGEMFDIASCMAQEVMYQNDECDELRLDSTGERLISWRGERPPSHYDTPEERWVRMRKWVAKKLGEEWQPVSASGEPK
jgi:hypothetical protein